MSAFANRSFNGQRAHTQVLRGAAARDERLACALTQALACAAVAGFADGAVYPR